MLDLIIQVISLLFSIPVLAYSYYLVVLFASSLGYPRPLGSVQSRAEGSPTVSALIAAYNERNVVRATLRALGNVEYPRSLIQVIVADDSTDDTVAEIDEGLDSLRSSGISTVVSRREKREGFKSGALNLAAKLISGEYVLLLDADSKVPRDIMAKGTSILQSRRDCAFVSFRVGHYNRERNLTTRLFALLQDTSDTLTKMGAYRINAPFSFQGGFTMIRSADLKEAGYWSDGALADDADLSCKIYASGKKGIYLSDVRITGEDPDSLEVWKKQTVRIAQGWGECLAIHFRRIFGSPNLSFVRKVALLMTLVTPASSISWLVVTFLSAFGLLFGVTSPTGSIFSNWAYIAAVSLPAVAFLGAGAYALRIQGILTPANLLVLVQLPYVTSCMFTASAVGFLRGLRRRRVPFFRTPKKGEEDGDQSKSYKVTDRFDVVAATEVILALVALAVSVPVFFRGLLFLGLSLFGFSIFTLKSMDLRRFLSPAPRVAPQEETVPSR